MSYVLAKAREEVMVRELTVGADRELIPYVMNTFEISKDQENFSGVSMLRQYYRCWQAEQAWRIWTDLLKV